MAVTTSRRLTKTPTTRRQSPFRAVSASRGEKWGRATNFPNGGRGTGWRSVGNYLMPQPTARGRVPGSPVFAKSPSLAPTGGGGGGWLVGPPPRGGTRGHAPPPRPPTAPLAGRLDYLARLHTPTSHYWRPLHFPSGHCGNCRAQQWREGVG